MDIPLFRRKLLAWYDRHRRDLPWRLSQDPYRVLVSELMLQQTQVKTAIPYYHRFLQKFPTARALAAAGLPSVLSVWAGLGYYRRARFLHAAAREVVRLGGFPNDREGLKALPGVGDYTAAAVGSIAFGLPLAVVDGNVIRVLSRLLMLPGNPLAGKPKARVWEAAGDLLDPARPGDYNQAVMELGALVCAPLAPSCGACPVAELCRARQQDRVERYPQLPARAAAVKVEKVVVLVTGKLEGKDAVLMAIRTGSGREGDEGRMMGMWSFPEKRVVSGRGKSGELAAGLAGESFKGTLHHRAFLKSFGHSVLHFQIRISAHHFQAAAGRPLAPWSWVPLARARRLPLASAEKKLLGFLAGGRGDDQVGT